MPGSAAHAQLLLATRPRREGARLGPSHAALAGVRRAKGFDHPPARGAAGRRSTAVPFVGFVAEPARARSLAGVPIEAAAADLVARVISNGQPHRALPLGVSMCLAVTARIEGSIVHAVTLAPVGVVVGFAAGGPSGIAARLLAQRLGCSVIEAYGAFVKAENAKRGGMLKDLGSKADRTQAPGRCRIAPGAWWV